MARSGFTSTVRRIRVVNRERSHWFSLLTVWLPVAVIVAGVVLWRLTRTDEPEVQAVQRPLSARTLSWVCDAGHGFKAAGQISPRICQTCNAPAVPASDVECPTHGVLTVQLMFEAAPVDPDRPRYAQYRTSSGSWTALKTSVMCPRCGAACRWLSVDPLYNRR
ncbi:MAG: hypothetical protein FLDDKLPJ_01399 [Phycisphaerae bacterium]|nr:hypothetical protein [Phycisphaerae bacterium]